MLVSVRAGDVISIKNLRANTSKHLVDGMPIGIKARKYRDAMWKIQQNLENDYFGAVKICHL